MTAEKVKKTVYLPEWLAKTLDDEAERAGSVSIFTAAAILSLCKASDQEKVYALRDYRDHELAEAYDVGGVTPEEMEAARERMGGVVRKAKERADRQRGAGQADRGKRGPARS